MEKEKYSKYITSEDFILDKEFFKWVLYPNKELDQFWSSFIKEYPEKGILISEAIMILKSIQPVEQEIPKENLDLILQKLKTSNVTIKLNRLKWMKYAAGLAVLISIGTLIWTNIHVQPKFPIAVGKRAELKGEIILANGSTREFDTEQTTIKQTASGKLTINTDTLDVKSVNTKSDINRIIIPYGKRSEVTLADGTHIWLNSGSQLSYPNEFKKDSREVYLSGEAYFDVKPNPKLPFYVITREIRIKVLGTSFNVSCYDEDNLTQTVLIKGKVSAGKNQLFTKDIELAPNERLIFDKKTNGLSKDHVDVSFYTSWISGYLVFKNEPITEVYKKLARYYNKNISAEVGLEKISFSGKLDLKNNLEGALENISFASSVKVYESNGSFIIKK